MPSRHGPGPRVHPRRTFLRLAALAPVAAGCATAAQPVAAPARSPPPPAPPPPPDRLAQAVEAIRGAPLPAGTQPAFVFRAPRNGDG